MTRIIFILLILTGVYSCGNTNKQEKNETTVSMNDDPSTILRIISTTPSYIPEKVQEEQAKDFLAKLFPANKIKSINKDTIEFVDQGQNFDSILCPFCKKDIETEYWQDAMEESEKSQFVNLTFTTPCCNKKTSLNDLKYITEAGFAKFILTVDDPEKEIKESDIIALQKLLNTSLRIIYTHY